MFFRKLLTNGEIILIATIVLCTVINAENDTAINAENDTAINAENDTAISTKNDTAINTENDTIVHYHLPDYIIPVYYDANIRLNYKTNDIIGECNITIHVYRQTKKISMHPVTFAIFKIALYENFSKQFYVLKYSFIHKLNMLTIDFTNTPKLPKFLSPGRYILIMAYMRHINNNKEHFSPSLYSDKNSDNMLTATGIDIMTSRELFPCWDEVVPHNYIFKISIKHHKNYSVLSNMPIQTTENDKHDMMWTHFQKSLMFIQHLKVVITTFTNIPTSVANITFWGRKNMTYYLHLAECIGQQVLHFLKHENNYNIDEFPKIDYIAFWDNQHNTSLTRGLIIHREADIIYDENLNSIRHKMKVAYFITYKILSCWYNDMLIWSKTSFYKLFATYILYQIFPDYDIINLFTVETQRESFLFDTPSNANEINENLIDYLADHIKSSNKWRMLYHLITGDVFWTGIRTYVTNKQYQTNLQNIIQIFLTKYSTNLNNKNVFLIKEFIVLWMMENYYPVLYVTRNHFINMTRFQYLTTDFIEKDRKHFPTFVTYTTKSVMNFQEIFINKSFWLSPTKSVTISEKFDENDWIIVNLQQTGYYRVNYDTENWLKLAQYMNSPKYINIDVLNRAQIIDDAFYFFINKQLDYVIFWKISEFLLRDTSYVAWYPMFKAFEYMTLIISIRDATNVKEKMTKILHGILYKVTYNSNPIENLLTSSLREEIIKWACIIGDKECRKMAKELMIEDTNFKIRVTLSGLKEWMYCNGLTSANSTIWFDVWNKGIATSNDKFLEYLTCSENPKIISEYLKLIWQHDFLLKRNNTRAHIFLLVVAKHVKNDAICDFILQNLKNNTFMLTSNTQTDIIAILIVIITHQYDVQQLEKVFRFVQTNLKEKRLVDAVQKKRKRRKNEYARKVNNYGLI